MNVIFMWKPFFGVTEDCFEIESRKSPSLFIIIIIIIIIIVIIIIIIIIIISCSIRLN